MSCFLIFSSFNLFAQEGDLETLPLETFEEELEEEPQINTTPKPRVKPPPVKPVPEGMELALAVYEVERGDCFYRISDRFYNDPSLWPDIWAYNTYVEDPHWIFPGNDLIIPGHSRLSKEAPREVKNSPKKNSPKEIKEIPRDKNVFLAPPEVEFDGCITGLKDEKLSMPAYGNLVFIDLGKDRGVKPKSRYGIYRKGREIVHPETGEYLGIIVRKIGLLQVTEDIEDYDSTALIINAKEPIKVGDNISLLNLK
ncbi:LysM peptidoglycan-binding domain-containing protein [bacterium]|nr:LysM peptidoglycan-binding domain-containing protein [bacterium]